VDRITVSFTEKQLDHLARVANLYSVTVSEIVRRLVERDRLYWEEEMARLPGGRHILLSEEEEALLVRLLGR
jgi:hypothetical protein